MEIKPIAHIYTEFSEKFGIPRQSGLVPELTGTIVFEPDYRNPDAVRGLEGYDYIWLIWDFSEAHREGWSPTVRPPMLGGNVRVGVFASRSPFRPNSLGLSSVRLNGIDYGAEGAPLLKVSGVDMVSGTPVYDIKPYLPDFDVHAGAAGGFSSEHADYRLEVEIPEAIQAELEQMIPGHIDALKGVLACDPRPGYKGAAAEGDAREYGVTFAGVNVKFTVAGDVLTVTGAEQTGTEGCREL